MSQYETSYNQTKSHPVLHFFGFMFKLCIFLYIAYVILGVIFYVPSSDDDSNEEVSQSPLVTDSSRAIPYRNIPVYFETRNPFHEDEYANFIDQPQVLLDYAGSVYVCDGTGENDCTLNYNVSNPSMPTFNDAGGYAKNDGTYRVFIHKHEDGDRSSSWYHDCLTHELGHQFDYANGISSSALWQQLYQQDPKAISDYGATNPKEFFADACEMYFNHPNDMQTQSRLPIYNAMQDIFQYYAQ